MNIVLVCATRERADTFFTATATGQSLSRIGRTPNVRLRITPENRLPLPTIYNAAIDEGAPDDLFVFIHDDVWLDDYFFFQRVREGLSAFDIFGLAGNIAILPDHVAWSFKDDKFTPNERSQLRGAVGHGATPFGAVSTFGEAPAEVSLLDGLLLAARGDRLRETGVRFDPQFDFHFYDLDFCRSAKRAGLRLGVWPIAVTHQSGGGFNSPAWRSKLVDYRLKWASMPAK